MGAFGLFFTASTGESRHPTPQRNPSLSYICRIRLMTPRCGNDLPKFPLALTLRPVQQRREIIARSVTPPPATLLPEPPSNHPAETRGVVAAIPVFPVLIGLRGNPSLRRTRFSAQYSAVWLDSLIGSSPLLWMIRVTDSSRPLGGLMRHPVGPGAASPSTIALPQKFLPSIFYPPCAFPTESTDRKSVV